MNLIKATLFLLIAALCVRGIPASAQKPVLKPSQRFGAVESYYLPDDAAAIGIGWDRMVFEWRNFQPNGPTEFVTTSIATRWLDDARKSGRQIVGLIKNAPKWATLHNLLGAAPQGLDLPADDPRNYWAQFVSKLTRYYSSQWGIHHWIIYNEPDIRPEDTQFYEFFGDIDEYYKVLKTAYKSIKAADPQAVIHLAGMSVFYDQQKNRPLYLKRLIQIAQKDPEGKANGLFFDVLTIHVYNFTQYVWTLTNLLAAIPAEAGYPKPIWIDELNARVTRDGKTTLSEGVATITLDDQAAFVVQSTANALALNAQGILIYRLWDNTPVVNGDSWGLIRFDRSKRPAYETFGMIIREFEGTISARRVSVNGVRIIRLTQKDRVLTILWNASSNPITIRTPAAADAELLSPLGKNLSLPLVNGYHEFTLPRCASGCFIEGDPRILKQTGAEPKLFLAVDGGQIPLD